MRDDWHFAVPDTRWLDKSDLLHHSGQAWTRRHSTWREKSYSEAVAKSLLPLQTHHRLHRDTSVNKGVQTSWFSQFSKEIFNTGATIRELQASCWHSVVSFPPRLIIKKRERKRIFDLVATAESLSEMTEEPDEIVFPIGKLNCYQADMISLCWDDANSASKHQ